MQKESPVSEFTLVDPTARMAVDTHGGRAKCLQRLIRLDMPVPTTVALPFDTVRKLAQGARLDTSHILSFFGRDCLLSVRPSSQDPDWGGPGAILNIGMTEARHARLCDSLGQTAADSLFARFIQTYAVQVARLDPDLFEPGDAPDAARIAQMLADYEDEAEEPFPDDRARQLSDVLRSMARAWDGTSARLLRQGRGAPADAGLGLVVQEMAPGVGPPESGSGVIQFVSSHTGHPQITGRYASQSQDREALTESDAVYLTKDERGPSLEELVPEVFADLIRHGETCRRRLREEMQIVFALDAGRLSVIDAVRIARTDRAAVRIAVSLARDGIIPRAEAVLRIAPKSLSALLHRQVDPEASREVIARGIGASPGAATGALVFTAEAAQAAAARGEPCILARRETAPEDIRGMQAAAGTLTERGGTTSHAAVIARGFGLPCVVGASDISIDVKTRRLIAHGHTLAEGDMITLDGSTGSVLIGSPRLVEPELGDAFRTLLDWADEIRDIGVRANADTPAEAQRARDFLAEGIGLCRTEHMFFAEDRLTVMREMIFAETAKDRAATLERLIPMQVADFIELFRIMDGRPVTIRLFDPPLHEFLPQSRSGLRELADAMGLPLAQVTRRVESMTEFNPMLGLRGVRLGVTMPEIYEAQARAIFLAAARVIAEGAAVVPEVMIPLVSARREVDLMRTRIESVAAEVRAETGIEFEFRLGVMAETPRACLRAGEIAEDVLFLSFGTNDLTQMTYGLSRDDAGRFMSSYVSQGVFHEDPFLTLDEEGVGELLALAVDRATLARPDITLSICGEHGGDPASIAVSRALGFHYVSCSPFRVPAARLAAAQATLRHRFSQP